MRLNPPEGREDETESQSPVITEVTTTGGTKVTFLGSVTLYRRVSQEHVVIPRQVRWGGEGEMFKEEGERGAGLRGVLITSPRTQNPIRLPPSPGGHSDLVGLQGWWAGRCLSKTPKERAPPPP